jgi:hypothetical protein
MKNLEKSTLMVWIMLAALACYVAPAMLAVAGSALVLAAQSFARESACAGVQAAGQTVHFRF